MPKEKTSSSAKLRDFVKEYGEKNSFTDGRVLFQIAKNVLEHHHAEVIVYIQV